MKAVVKLGGEVLEADTRSVAARSIRQALDAGHRLTIVHGGGPQTTALSKRLGIEPRFVGGRRITDEATLDVVAMTVGGSVHHELVAVLQTAGVPALGLAGVVRAHKRLPRLVTGGGSEPIDLGHVGDIDGFDLAAIDAALGAGRVPVLASLGVSAAGALLNINADVVASRLAVDMRVDALVAVASVGGVRRDKDDPATRCARLTVAEARAAIADGSIAGGMIPKIEEAFGPLEAGVAAVLIVGPDEIAAALAAPGRVGTTLVPTQL